MALEELIGRDPYEAAGKLSLTGFLLYVIHRLWNLFFSSNTSRIRQLEETVTALTVRVGNAETALKSCQDDHKTKDGLISDMMHKLGEAEGRLKILQDHDLEKHQMLKKLVEKLGNRS